ncbi:MAG: retropepsin-like aspartic protease [Myxococcaceae bacterium]
MSAKCYLHSSRAAEAICLSCGQKICKTCHAESLDPGLCPPCGARQVGRGKFRSVAGAAVVVLVLGAAAAGFVFTRRAPVPAPPAAAPPPAADAGFDYGQHAYAISNLRRALAADACQKRSALDLGNKLNAAGDFTGALDLVRGFEEACGAWPRLLWVSMYSRQQRREWKEAAEVATRLIEDRPADSDFWWWRGEAFAELGEYRQAAADYTQSVAALPNGFASGRYARFAKEKLAKPCDGAFALQYWLEQRPNDTEEWAKTRRSELFLSGGCEKVAGRGSASIRFTPNAPVNKTALKVNGKPATFIVSQATGTTLLSRAFAEKLGLQVQEDAKVTVYFAGEFRPAQLATLDRLSLGQAGVEKLQVAVVEQLPGEAPGVLGLNFFWHFSVKMDPASLAIAPLAGVQ